MDIYRIAAILSCGLITACDSGSSSRPVTADTVSLTEYGVLRISHDSPSDQTQIDAVFCSLTNPVAAATLDDQFQLAVDSCTVSNISDDDSPSEDTALACASALPAQAISAGANLTLTSVDGSYAELTRQGSDDELRYVLGSGPLPRPPNELRLSIPGDDFPAFTDVEIPDLQTLTVTAPAASEPVRSDTRFSWTAASGAPDSRLLLQAEDTDIRVTCSLRDDGSYRFSAATQAELGELFSAGNVSLIRQNFSTPTRGDTAIVLITSIN